MARKSKKKSAAATKVDSPNLKAASEPGLATASPVVTPWYQSVRAQALLFFAFAFVLYGNTLGHDFTVDDAIVITDNSLVQQGVAGIPDIFSYDTFYGFFEDESKANLVAGGRYRPLTLALFAVEQQVSAGPFISHLFNVIWYGGLLALLVFFVHDLLKERSFPWWLAPLIVGLFAAHPIHTEAVANIKGRDEITALFFAVAAAWLVWKSAVNQHWKGSVAGAVCLGIACLAKETAFTFLAVLPVTVLLFPPKSKVGPGQPAGLNWQGLKYCAPALAAALIYLGVRSSILPAGTDAPILELMNNPFVEWTGTVWREVPGQMRVATGFYTLLLYLKLSFLPVGLVHDYYPTSIALQRFSDLGPWLGLLLHVAIGGFALVKARTHRLLALGVVIYLAGISVASNILFPVGTLMSERFLFFPSLGWALAVGYLIFLLSKKVGASAAYLGVGVVVIFSVLTILRNPDWKDNYTLFTTDVKTQPNSAKLLNAAGGARVDKYQSYAEAARPGQVQLLKDAIVDLDRAIEIHPTYRNAFLIRGNAKLLQEQFDPAIADYEAALELSPNYQPAEDNLFIALKGAGRKAGEERGDIKGAFAYLRKAEAMRPLDYEVLRLLGVASGVSGNGEEALAYFKKAASIRPNDADAVWNYGMALHNSGLTDEGQVQFQKAKQIRPSIVQERGAQ